ncbi:MAG: hypothetical protein HQK75_06700 [Candidatus Magnetomorum sp.]|nr:hypothetical protein [Candidatus Magnetomorum sp.]
MIYMTIIASILIAIGLSFLEYMTEGHISYFPAVIAFLLIIPIRQMTILTRDIDRISKKMLHIQDCLQVNAKMPKPMFHEQTMVREKRKS